MVYTKDTSEPTILWQGEAGYPPVWGADWSVPAPFMPPPRIWRATSARFWSREGTMTVTCGEQSVELSRQDGEWGRLCPCSCLL